MILTSDAFSPGADIPRGHTCEGRDTSPPLSWSDVDAATKSFALIVDDPDAPDPAAPKTTWVHWVAYNIPRVRRASRLEPRRTRFLAARARA